MIWKELDWCNNFSKNEKEIPIRFLLKWFFLLIRLSLALNCNFMMIKLSCSSWIRRSSKAVYAWIVIPWLLYIHVPSGLGDPIRLFMNFSSCYIGFYSDLLITMCWTWSPWSLENSGEIVLSRVIYRKEQYKKEKWSRHFQTEWDVLHRAPIDS